MTSANKSELSKMWLAFPPIVSTPILLLLFVTGSKLRATSVPTAIWGVAFIGYLFMCLAFLGFMKVKNNAAAVAASTVGQGLIFSVFSLSLGSEPILSWGGLFILLLGGILALRGFSIPKTQTVDDILFSEQSRREDLEDILHGLPLPAFLLDAAQRVITLNDEAENIIGKTELSVRGNTLSEIVVLDTKRQILKANELEWSYHTTVKNSRSLLMLTPRVYESAIKGELNVVDKETGLYIKEFIPKKGKEELERSQRYNRRLTVMLIQLFCAEGASEQEEKTAYLALAAATGILIRSCDIAFRIQSYQILLFLPDTPVAGARRLVERIVADVERLSAIESVMPSGCYIQSGITSYLGKGAHTVESMVNDVQIELSKSIRSGQISGHIF